MDEVDGKGHQIVHSQLEVRGEVPDCDEAAFAQAAEAADASCPFSALIRAIATVAVIRIARLRAYPSTISPGGRTMATERTMSTTWHGSLMDGLRHDRRGQERRLRRPRRELGIACRSAETARRARRS